MTFAELVRQRVLARMRQDPEREWSPSELSRECRVAQMESATSGWWETYAPQDRLFGPHSVQGATQRTSNALNTLAKRGHVERVGFGRYMVTSGRVLNEDD